MSDLIDLRTSCRKCKGRLAAGVALKPAGVHYVHGDFSGDYEGTDLKRAQRGQTVTFHPVGPADLMEVVKCLGCGHSFSANEPMSISRYNQIREEFNDTCIDSRDPGDVAIGELLDEVDRLSVLYGS